MNVKKKILKGWFKLAAVMCVVTVATMAAASGDSRRDKAGTWPGAETTEASQVSFNKSLAKPRCSATERAGFEPAVHLIGTRRFSKPVHSATLPPLRW
jgi:hypothetical protein